MAGVAQPLGDIKLGAIFQNGYIVVVMVFINGLYRIGELDGVADIVVVGGGGGCIGGFKWQNTNLMRKYVTRTGDTVPIAIGNTD